MQVNLHPALLHNIHHIERQHHRLSQIMGQVGMDFTDIVDRSYETDIINEKYDFIEEIIEECLVNKQTKAAFTDRVDRLLTHRYLGLPMFLCIMAAVFFLTFFIGDWLKGAPKSKYHRDKCAP